jgi:SAM-dependent methyltransferase
MLAMQTAALSELRALEQRLAAAVDAADARTDELVLQVDELRARVQQQAQLMSLPPGSEEPELDAYPAAPAEPWGHEYNAAHAAFVARALDDGALLEAIRGGDALPDGYGAGFDERVVELAWVASRRLGGSVLDAGSSLNHLHLLRRLRPRMDDLHIVTLAPEDRAFPSLGVSYVFADLRDLPMRDGAYDRVLSISTLEHVGTDTAYYGGETRVADDPQRELLAAVAELRRVLKPGGDCYITVPVGRGERFEWVRSLTPAQVDEIAAAFEPETSEAEFFRYAGGAWQRSDRDGVAGAHYRDHFTSNGLGPDGVVAAEAVACLHLVKPG